MATGRYAPSPTGQLHYGNLRTALLAWLFARSAGSRFLLRIEDLDPERSRAEFEAGQIADLEAIGISWDGPVVRQSERGQLYLDAVEELKAQDRVYPCWCSRAEIRAAIEAPNAGRDRPPGAYPGTCRTLTRAERADRERSSARPPALRLDAGGTVIEFADRLHGRNSGAVDDFVLRRWDGAFAYNLAVTLDDAEQGVEQVVRGEDLLETTPRQLLLYDLLGLRRPEHAHVPLVLGPDRERLAKRHGSVSLGDLGRLGIGPGTVVAEMAAGLGLAEPGEKVEAATLVERFSADRLPIRPTVLTPRDAPRSSAP